MKRIDVKIVFCLFLTVYGQTFNPISFSLPPPPMLMGPLSPNYALFHSERLHQLKIRGPTSFAFLGGYTMMSDVKTTIKSEIKPEVVINYVEKIEEGQLCKCNVYTVTADKRIVNIAPCNPKTISALTVPGCRTISECGVLTSIRVDNNGKLLVLDAYKGVYRVDPVTGIIEQLYSSTTPVGGRTPIFLNDMVVKSDGTVFITDSSDKFDASRDMYIILEGRPSGRILVLTPSTKEVNELITDGIVYPNGIELSANETELLISEMGRARIMRISIVPPNFRELTIFSENLPGMPENIRRSARNTFWVGISYVRHAGIPNSMDIFAGNPEARARTAYSVDQNTIRTYYPRHGLVVELDATGKPVGSLHDPTGQAFGSVSEAVENEGLLYVGLPNNAFAGRIVLPQGDNRMVTVDSVLQVLRSRCQIPEERLEQARVVLQQYIHLNTANATQPRP